MQIVLQEVIWNSWSLLNDQYYKDQYCLNKYEYTSGLESERYLQHQVP